MSRRIPPWGASAVSRFCSISWLMRMALSRALIAAARASTDGNSSRARDV
jgi:hypothetical protein